MLIAINRVSPMIVSGIQISHSILFYRMPQISFFKERTQTKKLCLTPIDRPTNKSKSLKYPQYLYLCGKCAGNKRDANINIYLSVHHLATPSRVYLNHPLFILPTRTTHHHPNLFFFFHSSYVKFRDDGELIVYSIKYLKGLLFGSRK